MSTIIGIDLGTTNSLCAVVREGEPELIANVHGHVLTPSVVGVLEDDILVGHPALELRVTKPDQCARGFKRLMGSDRKETLGERTLSAPELSSLVLRSLKDDAERYLETTITEAVITVPAYFNDHQRTATRLAGKLAGLNVRRIINEPTAAALMYGFREPESESKVLVIDLGGGTFDVTLMEIFEGSLEIVSTAGESFLGGEDFTDAIVADVLRSQGVQFEVAEVRYPHLVSRLRLQAEAGKRAINTADSMDIRIPGPDGTIAEDAGVVTMTRGTFASATAGLMGRLRRPIEKVLRDGRTSPAELDEVILVGGATRMTCVQDFIEEVAGRKPQLRFNPDEVVALGAALQAALIAEDSAVDDLVMTDVCPFTLGISVGKEFGGHREDGYFAPIIHRNTTIPVSREQTFCTSSANQTTVHVEVYQGESRRVADNLLLGELVVHNIPLGPAGQAFYVRFTYDLNGILEVEAVVADTGEKCRAVITNRQTGMSEKEVRDAVARMQEIKFYPRDDIRNQRLVLFAERVVGELPPHERETLENTLDAFESALRSGERELFAAVRNALLVTLSELGFAFEDREGGASDD